MERAKARVVKVRESRERERRDIWSSMATQGKEEAGGGRVRGQSETKRGKNGNTTLRDKTTQDSGYKNHRWSWADRCFWLVYEVMNCQV